MAREIPLTKGMVAIVDEEDYIEISNRKWHYGSTGYAARSVKSRDERSMILMHRQVVGLCTGKVVDHINGNKLDNRRANLRITDQIRNQANRPKVNRNNKTGYKGVSWHKRGGKYEAGVNFQGKRHFLGLFTNKHEAARAYNAKALELFGEYARLNVIEGDDVYER